MKKSSGIGALIVALPLVFALAACDDAPPPTDVVAGRVTHIVDGDTFFVGKTRVRICGIDAPPQGHPGYRDSAKFLQRLIEGKRVHCLPRGAGADCVGRGMPQSAGRVVAQCFVGETDLADAMVDAGHAKDWRQGVGR